ncbi:fibrous sheath-interacting protein 1 isoform X1 [Carassius gibelio]|uniref:fibrous sheath-interacting protein 1 isoform X1 n=1 Tax=Carassius gibelio TaxID=101364 RepID=UPI002278B00E|nr:fibrous sheath-interacting protein 1 isoform X1 [Carassius gibelio]
MEVSAGDVSRTLEIITARADPQASEEESSGCSAEKLLTDQVSVDRMDITKGFLDDISRPASSEIRRLSRDGPRSLEVLSPDVTHAEQVHRDTTDLTAENSSDQEESDEENEDPELREAIKKMKRLDRVLALKASAEREVKQRGRQQHQRLWQELQTAGLRMSSNETDNTRRFLALTPDNYQDCDEVDRVPVFETEVLDLKSDLNTRHETDGQDQPSDDRQRGAAHSKHKQDFVRRNIELAEAWGNSFLLTQQEKERIEELLKDVEEEENHSELQTEAQVVSSSLSAGEGFAPEPSELHSLRHIDSRLELLLPVQDFLSVRSPSQGSLQENTGDGERQRRDEERRLREIQQQLQILEENEPGASVLSDDQLRNLLQECEEDMLRSPAGSSSESSLGTSSALDASPRLSDSDLLRDARHSDTDTEKQA